MSFDLGHRVNSSNWRDEIGKMKTRRRIARMKAGRRRVRRVRTKVRMIAKSLPLEAKAKTRIVVPRLPTLKFEESLTKLSRHMELTGQQAVQTQTQKMGLWTMSR
jgi:hypothetical protein